MSIHLTSNNLKSKQPKTNKLQGKEQERKRYQNGLRIRHDQAISDPSP